MFSTSIAINSSLLASSASAILFSARWRSEGVVSRHSTNALLAALNALSTSAAPETGAVAYALPVAGLMISLVAPDFAGRDFPSIKLFSFFILRDYLGRGQLTTCSVNFPASRVSNGNRNFVTFQNPDEFGFILWARGGPLRSRCWVQRN